jgi:hypothetical protein
MYDWLAQRVEWTLRTAKALELNSFRWTVNAPARDEELQSCESALARIGIPFSPSHRAFLSLNNGAEFSFGGRTRDDVEWGDSMSILPTSSLEAIANELDPANGRDTALGRPHFFWDATLPVIDLRDLNYLVINPRIITEGESSVFYSGSELGPTYGDGMFYAAPSFELCLMRIFDNVGIRREPPEFWHRRSRLRHDRSS